MEMAGEDQGYDESGKDGMHPVRHGLHEEDGFFFRQRIVPAEGGHHFLKKGPVHDRIIFILMIKEII